MSSRCRRRGRDVPDSKRCEAVGSELDEICQALDDVLQGILADWQEDLANAEQGDVQLLYCVYPNLVSTATRARGILHGAQHFQQQFHQRKQMKRADAGCTSSSIGTGGMAECCPCCGGSHRAQSSDIEFGCGGQNSVHHERRIVQETIIEETDDGRGFETGGGGRR
ncbi:hypothetical protein [Roseibium algae]|uniref:Uncharacterized protein n=1 Tax=Roseibium algae TaxID=3123038 RepID=A0ABU8TKU5_9HYPH